MSAVTTSTVSSCRTESEPGRRRQARSARGQPHAAPIQAIEDVDGTACELADGAARAPGVRRQPAQRRIHPVRKRAAILGGVLSERRPQRLLERRAPGHSAHRALAVAAPGPGRRRTPWSRATVSVLDSPRGHPRWKLVVMRMMPGPSTGGAAAACVRPRAKSAGFSAGGSRPHGGPAWLAPGRAARRRPSPTQPAVPAAVVPAAPPLRRPRRRLCISPRSRWPSAIVGSRSGAPRVPRAWRAPGSTPRGQRYIDAVLAPARVGGTPVPDVATLRGPA